jgi:hypothetical protein
MVFLLETLEVSMDKHRPKCIICDILFDVPCSNAACEGHQNERIGNICAYCATNVREKPSSLEEPLGLYVSGLGDCDVCLDGESEGV